MIDIDIATKILRQTNRHARQHYSTGPTRELALPLLLYSFLYAFYTPSSIHTACATRQIWPEKPRLVRGLTTHPQDWDCVVEVQGRKTTPTRQTGQRLRQMRGRRMGQS